MLIGSDGKFYAKASDLPGNVVAAAMIAYLGTEAEGAEHGLAIALEDAGSTSWGDAEAVVSSWVEEHPMTDGTWRLPSVDDWKYMFAGCGGDPYDPSLDYTGNYGRDVNCGNFRNMLTAAGNADVSQGSYWSSLASEDKTNCAWGYSFVSGRLWEDYMSDSEYVRAVLAF